MGKRVKAVKPELERYVGLVQQIKDKSKERKALLAEKKERPFYQIPKLHDLTRCITELTEELEELKTEKAMLLRSLDCADDVGISAVKKEIAALESALQMMIACGIALQNIPEGMVIIAPMLAAGVSPVKTFVCAMVTGLIEVVGTLLGYWAVSIASAILPFALAFAGGTMLYVISDEMIPETHAHGSETGATYALLAGFCVMLVSDFFLG